MEYHWFDERGAMGLGHEWYPPLPFQELVTHRHWTNHRHCNDVLSHAFQGMLLRSDALASLSL